MQQQIQSSENTSEIPEITHPVKKSDNQIPQEFKKSFDPVFQKVRTVLSELLSENNAEDNAAYDTFESCEKKIKELFLTKLRQGCIDTALRIKEELGGNINFESIDGDRIIYVADLARQPGYSGAGAEMVNAFLELYFKNYLQKGDFIPIYAQFRKSTSYKFVTGKLKALEKRLGIQTQVEELDTYQEGQDTMHRIIIRPMKS